ncbi:hypothetical protein J31TS4_19620 [Paenibacillus sp. J31TS4]|uniref:hypothetical protein n=1 Tax=Paenibacillus sp. J31TS4 TaxID=2807195 RepID=UPI001B02D8A6|nr:hypothetical protein [Paenibacillus sp. J31TS4]GIP38682.1 hypothetical protein J31TS4_19620 [Paenibacillus sp. J31TS4]
MADEKERDSKRRPGDGIGPVPRSRRLARAAARIALLTAAGVLLIQLFPMAQEPAEREASRWYVPEIIQPGDRIGGMTAAGQERGTYGVGSFVTAFTGPVELTGTYEHRYREPDVYNAGQIIFTPDEASAAKLPQAEQARQWPTRLVLTDAVSAHAEAFGTPGTTGTAAVVLSRYTDVYADILEGVSNAGELVRAEALTAVPPPAPEAANPGFTAALAPFPALTLSPDGPTEEEARGVAGWLSEVSRVYLTSLAPGRISDAQRASMKTWLHQAFTEEKAEALLAEAAQPAGDGSWTVSGGWLNLLPPSEIKEVRGPALAIQADGGYVYTAVAVLAGTHDAELTIRLMRKDGGWRIAEYGYRLI